MDIKNNFSENLKRCRHQIGLTQSELAEKLNYSDKAISKWERGESLPDLEVAKQMADLFDVSIDFLLSTPKKEKVKIPKKTSKLRVIVCLLVIALVWTLSVLAYSFLGVLFPATIDKTWLSFIWAITLTFIVLLVFTSAWGKNLYSFFSSSILSWSSLLSIYLTITTVLTNLPNTLWMIFLIGIPVQFILILVFFYKSIKKALKHQ